MDGTTSESYGEVGIALPHGLSSRFSIFFMYWQFMQRTWYPVG
jgi:hypothetical protein